MRPAIFAAALALISFIAEAPQVQAQQATSPFPDGQGRELIVSACTQCHGAQPITQLRMGEHAWRQQINNMVLRGAQIRPSEIDAAQQYLAANFGPGVPDPNEPRIAVKLAGGPGGPLVAGACAICHGLDRVVAAARPGTQWDAMVHRMVEIGAPVDAEQTEKVAAYLKANYAGPAVP